MKTRRGKVPFAAHPPLPQFATCPMCTDVVPLDQINTSVVIDGEQKKICDSCAWSLDLGNDSGRIDE